MQTNLWEEIYRLFDEMTTPAGILLFVGLLLVVVEIFQSTRMISGGIGLFMTISGIVVRMLCGGSLPMLFALIFICCFVIMAAYVVMLRVCKYGWLSRAPVTGVGKEAAENKDYYFLLNLEGTATSDIRVSGKIAINGIEFSAESQDYVPQGCRVRVVSVQGRRITVKKI